MSRLLKPNTNFSTEALPGSCHSLAFQNDPAVGEPVASSQQQRQSPSKKRQRRLVRTVPRVKLTYPTWRVKYSYVRWRTRSFYESIQDMIFQNVKKMHKRMSKSRASEKSASPVEDSQFSHAPTTMDDQTHSPGVSYVEFENVKNRAEQLHVQNEFLRGFLEMHKKKSRYHSNLLNAALTQKKRKIDVLTREVAEKEQITEALSKRLEQVTATSAYRGTALKTLRKEIDDLKDSRNDLSQTVTSMTISSEALLEENNFLRVQMEALRGKIGKLVEVAEEMEKRFEEQLSSTRSAPKSIETSHDLCKLNTAVTVKQLMQLYDTRLDVVVGKLSEADDKINELYSSLEQIVKGVHKFKYFSDLKRLESTECWSSSLGDSSSENPCNVIPQLGDWLLKCNKLVHEKRFADELSSFVLSMVALS